jgi:hypothetical protein
MSWQANSLICYGNGDIATAEEYLVIIDCQKKLVIASAGLPTITVGTWLGGPHAPPRQLINKQIKREINFGNRSSWYNLFGPFDVSLLCFHPRVVLLPKGQKGKSLRVIFSSFFRIKHLLHITVFIPSLQSMRQTPKWLCPGAPEGICNSYS